MKKLYLALFSFAAVGMSNAQISSFPYQEDFESEGTCGTSCATVCALSTTGWTNLNTDDKDWAVDVGGTGSSNTGPSIDFNPGTGAGKYLYTEATSCFNQTAELISPVFDFSANAGMNLVFAYHMWGGDMGTLEISVSTDGGATFGAAIWSQGGADLGDVWNQDTVSLVGLGGQSNVVIKFTGTTGANFESDMAIDDIVLYEPLIVDAGISAFYSPTTPACNSNVDVWVEITNYGINDLTSATIEWSQNAVMQTPVSWSGLLVQGQTDSVNLGTLTIADGDVLQAYTTFPNFVTEGPGGAGNDTTTINIGFGLSGTYTIDGGGAGDYIDFNSAVADLMTLGACGNVVFEVADGTYNEQVLIGEYAGAGVTGDVSFVGANGAASAVDLTFAATLSGDNYTVRFDGADYVNFKHIGISATGATYGRAIEFENGADNNTIDSCLITGDQAATTTSTNKCVIYSSSGTTNDNNAITNSAIDGGSYAVYYYGGGTSSRSTGFVFENNSVQNWYYQGVRTYYVDQVQINNNDLRSSGSYTGTHYGIYAYYADGQNSIADNIVTIQNGYGYGMYLVQWFASAVNRSMVYNNQISLGAQSASSSSAIYASTINNADFANNSIWIDDNATASEGIYMTNGTGNNIWNNNIHNVGPGYGLYLNGGFNNVDYNNLYVPNGNVGYFGQAHTTLMDWQTASGLDQNSYSVDPMYPSNILLTTCNDTLDNAAAPLAFVMNDLSGKMRSSMPDIGAYEFDGVASFSLGIDTTICSNGTIDLGDAASDANWMWNTGDTTNVITVAGSPGGTFIATRMSSCGTAIDTIVVTPAPTPVAAFDTTFTSFATVVFNNMSTDSDSYMWDFGDGNTSTDENPTHIYANGGVYTVTLIANGPCGADTTTYVLNLEITSLDELSASIDMFPNPANDVLTINADEVLDASIEVYSVSGKLVLSENIQGTTKTINVSDLENGMYMIKITNEEGSSIQRLIVE